MATVTDLITASLQDIGALAPGESIDSNLAQQALSTLNYMVNEWSNERLMIPYQTEIIHNITNGVLQYTIGPGGTISATGTGSFAGTVLTVNTVSSGAITLGQTVSGTSVSSGTVITQFGTGAGTVSTAPGTYTVNNAQTLTNQSLSFYYQRPLAIRSAFVRISSSATSGLDYPVAILNVEEYELIGLKFLNGPWPRTLYYQPSIPLGNIFYWPNPSQGEMHLFADTVLGNFTTLSDTLTIPQGYFMALRWNLAEMLLPAYGKMEPTQVQMIAAFAQKSKGMIKRTNMHPPQVVQFDDVLKAGRRKDAGWILHGGFL